MNVRCKCGRIIGRYHGDSFFVLAEKNIGGFVVLVKLGESYNVGSGDVGGRILCVDCVDKEGMKVE